MPVWKHVRIRLSVSPYLLLSKDTTSCYAGGGNHFRHPLCSQLCSKPSRENFSTAHARARARIAFSSAGESESTLCHASAKDSGDVAWKPSGETQQNTSKL